MAVMRLMMVLASTLFVLALMTGRAEAAAEPSWMPLPLKVVGTRILNSKNEPVTLRGVNCACLEWTNDGEGHIVQSVKVAIDDWHVNHIRLPPRR